MRVRCVQIVDTSGPTRGERLKASPHIEVGEEFHVLSMLIDGDSEAALPHLLQILDRDGSPTWWPLQMFETLSSAIPPNWEIHLDAMGSLQIAPGAWLRPGFWEEYFDNPGDGDAAETFRCEVDIIVTAGSSVP